MPTSSILDGIARARADAQAQLAVALTMWRDSGERGYLAKVDRHRHTVHALDAAQVIVELADRPRAVVRVVAGPVLRAASLALQRVDEGLDLALALWGTR